MQRKSFLISLHTCLLCEFVCMHATVNSNKKLVVAVLLLVVGGVLVVYYPPLCSSWLTCHACNRPIAVPTIVSFAIA